MNALLMDLSISFVVGIVLSTAMHILFLRNEFLRDSLLSSITAITVSALLGIIPLSYFFWDNQDFVSDLNLFEYLIPLCGAALILLASFSLDVWTTVIVTGIVSGLSVFFSGITIAFMPQFPDWLNMILTIITLWGFSCCFYCVSGLTPFPQSQGAAVALGIAILACFHAAPMLMGLTAAMFFGIMCVAYVRGRFQPIALEATPVLGYIVGWFGLISYAEYILPCFATFIMYLFAESVVALFRKITTLARYRELPYNSTLYQIFDESESSELVTRLIMHTEVILIILGVFQINSDNVFSFPVFAAMFCAWQQYRTLNWRNPDKTIKDTNKEVISSIKKSFNSLFGQSDDNKNTDDE